MATKVKIVILVVFLAALGAAAAVAVTLGMQRGTSTAATVNGEAIFATELNHQLEAVAKQYNIDFNSEAGRKQRGQIARIILDQLIEQRLILQEARRLGAAATAEQVDKAIQDIKTNFSSESEFQVALASRGLTLADLRERLRVNLTVQNLQARVSTATVSDEEIAAYYAQHRKEYDRPEQVRVRHILVETEDAARLVLARLNRGEKFNELAQQLSKDPGSKDQGGDLGFISRGQMVPEFEKAAFALPTGQISGIVKTQYGYHVLQVTDRKAGQPGTLEQARDQIRRQLLAKKQEADFAAWLRKAKQQARITRNEAVTK